MPPAEAILCQALGAGGAGLARECVAGDLADILELEALASLAGADEVLHLHLLELRRAEDEVLDR